MQIAQIVASEGEDIIDGTPRDVAADLIVSRIGVGNSRGGS